MEIRQLQSFLAVAGELNFTRAARTLHITVPPLTRQIQALEHELGQQLFDRSTHHVALTATGERLVVLAGSIVADVEAIPARLRPDADTGAVRVSVPFALNPRVRDALSAAMSAHAGDYVFAISQVASKDVSRALRENRVDLALTHIRPEDTDAESREIDREALGVLLDCAHLPEEQSSVTSAELRGFSYVHGPRSWEIEEMVHAQQQLFAAGVVDRAEERYDDLAAMLIALGGARTLSLRSCDAEELQGLSAARFRVLPVSDLDLGFATHVAWRRGDTELAMLRADLIAGLDPRS